MNIETSELFGRAAKTLKVLRKKDPAKNLSERWKRLLEKRPDFEAKYGFVSFVIDPGWAVVYVPDDAVAYTVGLHYRFGQKEVLISAPKLSGEAQKKLLNQLARRVIVDGERFEAGQKVVFDDGKSFVTLQAFRDQDFDKYPCGYLARFEQYFEDRFHTAGGTLPVLWGVLQTAKARPTAKKVKAKAKPRRAG